MFEMQRKYGRILKSLNIVNLYRGMSNLKLKINVKVPQLLCIVVSVALKWRIWAIWWVLRWLLLYVIRRRQGWKAYFWPVQREADFHPEIRIARLPNRTHKLKGWLFFSWHSIEDPFKIKALTAQIIFEKCRFGSDQHPRHDFRLPRSNRHSVCSTLIGWC